MRPKKINRPAPINPVAEPSSSATARRFVLIGGFLGAGKTTVINEFCKWLKNKTLVPGVITNDQGNGLIDTASATRQAAHVREVTGGCFCCRANALGAALAALEESARPDVFIAEPVGSCTDLMATLVLPLASIYGQPLTAAPMSVLIDAARLEAAMLDELTGSPGGKRSGFTADVRYIFEKQLEEAELLVLNKADMLTPRRLEAVRSWLAGKHPGKQILSVSNKTGKGLDEWFTLLMAEVSHPSTVRRQEPAARVGRAVYEQGQRTERDSLFRISRWWVLRSACGTLGPDESKGSAHRHLATGDGERPGLDPRHVGAHSRSGHAGDGETRAPREIPSTPAETAGGVARCGGSLGGAWLQRECARGPHRRDHQWA
jgi:G3E family GTPase